MPQERQSTGLPLLEAARAMGVPVKEGVGPTDRWVEANGLRLHYLDWGTAGKPPILLLHGGFQTAHSWDFVSLALVQDHHVVALDQRGHGDSAWAPDGDYSHRAMQQDLDAVTTALGLDRFILVGLSMGGRNAIMYTARHPQRVRALVMVDIGPETQRRGRENIARFVTGSREASFEEFLQRARRFNPRRPEEQLRGSLLHNLRQLPNGQWTWKYDERLRHRVALDRMEDEDLGPYIQALHCPTLIVRGEVSDVLTPEAAERLRQAIPGSRLVTIPGAGHLVPGDNPADFIQAVQAFLAEVAAP